jgi:hypothetical protein
MNDNQLKVIAWIRSGMDFNSGLSLLVEMTNKQIYYNLFSGKELALADKLAYEICKAALLANHITWKDFIQKVKEGEGIEFTGKTEEWPDGFPEFTFPGILPGEEIKPKIGKPDSATMNDTIETAETAETPENKPLTEYPSIIRRIIHEYV